MEVKKKRYVASPAMRLKQAMMVLGRRLCMAVSSLALTFAGIIWGGHACHKTLLKERCPLAPLGAGFLWTAPGMCKMLRGESALIDKMR